MVRKVITQRSTLHPRAMARDQVKPGVKYRTLDPHGRVIERGEFNSRPETIGNRLRVDVIIENGPKETHFLDDMGIVPRPNTLWRKDRFTMEQ